MCDNTRAPDSRVSYSAYNEFINQLLNHLDKTTVKYISSVHTMTNLMPDFRKRYDDVLQYCLHDGIHWNHSDAQAIITQCLSKLFIKCPIEKHYLSPFRLAVQKSIPDGCYKCASQDHKAESCQVSLLKCSNCSKQNHTDKACGYQWLPCRQCGQIGHNVGDRSKCPVALSNTLTNIHMA